ncbi:hypothetical protein EON65_32755 [archaeon]|nr:MAG: hypothetical protein EON65_32755 [archaeon]
MHCPQQDNGYDCGVFVVIFASFILDYITTNELSKDAIAWASNLSAYLHGKFVADLPSRTRKHYRARIDELKR